MLVMGFSMTSFSNFTYIIMVEVGSSGVQLEYCI